MASTDQYFPSPGCELIAAIQPGGSITVAREGGEIHLPLGAAIRALPDGGFVIERRSGIELETPLDVPVAITPPA